LDQTPGFSTGLLVCAKSASDPSHYIIGSLAAINGDDIDITVSIAAGGTALADWVVTYPISGSLGDANGDLLLPNGSSSAGDADADLNAGGNRAFMDVASGVARIGNTSGGGSNLPLALVSGIGGVASDVIKTDAGSTDKTISGGNSFSDGAQFMGQPLGSVSATTVSLVKSSREVQVATIGASVIFDFGAPDADHHYTKTIQITQDGTGGRVPVFNRATLATQVQWTTAEPAWASQAAGTVTRVTAQYLDGWLYLSAKEGIKT
jgi:hypothetical protein